MSNTTSFSCQNCASDLKYNPGTDSMLCQHCGQLHEIKKLANNDIEELSYYATLKDISSQTGSSEESKFEESAVIQCQQCAATFPFDNHIQADDCPYCGTSIVNDGKTQRQIAPWGLLPFKIQSDEAWKQYKRWLSKLWFAPNALKKFARTHQKLHGMYVPYWTFDSNTSSEYIGKQGTYYQEATRVMRNVNGKNIMQTQMVTKIRWRHAKGRVNLAFDDILVYASKTLPKSMAKELEPWDLTELIPYQNEYLSGFTSELYQVGLEQGFDNFSERINPRIHSAIRNDIGGDTQQIINVQTAYSKVKFKHILLPFWTAGFRYNKKTYQFIVNGRTGEVQGQRPYSWIKIGLLGIIVALIAAAGIYTIAQNPETLRLFLEFIGNSNYA